jgi:hypothetical protein
MSFYTFHPPFKADLAGEDGIITPAWRVWTQNIFDTIGSADGQLRVNANGIVSTKNPGSVDIAGDPGLYLEGVRWPDDQTIPADRVFQYNGTGLDLVDPFTLGLPTTGDVTCSIRTSKDDWVIMNDGTIGSASSGASNRANADTEDLFTLIWNNVSDTDAPVSSGRGASASADFSANKTITLPKSLGRILSGAGNGSGLTTRDLGSTTGVETHTLTLDETPNHTHTISCNRLGTGSSVSPIYVNYLGPPPITDNTSSAGGGNAHNNMQPTTFLNYFIKL